MHILISAVIVGGLVKNAFVLLDWYLKPTNTDRILRRHLDELFDRLGSVRLVDIGEWYLGQIADATRKTGRPKRIKGIAGWGTFVLLANLTGYVVFAPRSASLYDSFQRLWDSWDEALPLSLFAALVAIGWMVVTPQAAQAALKHFSAWRLLIFIGATAFALNATTGLMFFAAFLIHGLTTYGGNLPTAGDLGEFLLRSYILIPQIQQFPQAFASIAVSALPLFFFLLAAVALLFLWLMPRRLNQVIANIIFRFSTSESSVLKQFGDICGATAGIAEIVRKLGSG